MELSPGGKGLAVGRGRAQFGYCWGKGPRLRADRPPAPRGADTNTRAQPLVFLGEGGRRENVFHSSQPHTARREGGQQGEEVTGEQEGAASATTLQQCGLPGSSAQPGGTAAASGAPAGRAGGAGGLGQRCSAGLLGREGGFHEAAPTMQQSNARVAPCSREAALPPAWLPFPPHCVNGFPAMALSQSLIPAYPPLTSFQGGAADARDFRVALCTVPQRANSRGDKGRQQKWRKEYREWRGKKRCSECWSGASKVVI